MSAIQEIRQKNFKNNGKDLDNLRRRCTETCVELRKQKKIEQVFKRRNICDENEISKSAHVSVSSHSAVLLNEIFAVINTAQNYDDILPAVRTIRKILSEIRNPPIDDVVNANLVPFLISYLDLDNNPQLQFEAAWAITNIASGTSQHTQYIVELGVVPKLIRLLSSTNAIVYDQAVWALGNIAGDCAEMREYVTKLGIIEPLLTLFQFNDIPIKFLRNITWTLANLCRYTNPSPSIETVTKLLPALEQLLYHNDNAILIDTCRAFAYVSKGSSQNIEAIVKMPAILPRLVELINVYCETEIDILSPALRTIGNIVSGNSEQTQCVIDANALPIFHALLTHKNTNIKKEAAWALSNITAGTPTQIEAVINANLIPLLVHVLANSEFQVQKEAALVFAQFTSGAQANQILYLIQCQVIKPMCDLLVSKDPKIIKILLDGLLNVLTAAQKCDQLEDAKAYIEEVGGLDKIEKLQGHENDEIYNMAYKIIEKFFMETCMDEEESLIPEYEFTSYKIQNSNPNDFPIEYSF